MLLVAVCLEEAVAEKILTLSRVSPTYQRGGMRRKNLTNYKSNFPAFVPSHQS